MTRSYIEKYFPDADYTPNDIGPIEGSNKPGVKFEDLERTEEYWEKMQEMQDDLLEYVF